MTNVFIAAIIAFFIWHRVSKEEKTRIRNANGYKVIIFAIISFVLAVFYWKTYQVATISNYVNIEAWQYGENKDGTNCDTINELKIINRFNSSALLPPLFNRTRTKTELQVDSFLEKRGGLFIEMRHNNHPFAIKRKEVIPDDLYNQIGIEVPNNGQLTSVDFITTEIPMMFPLKTYHIHDSITPEYSEHGFEVKNHFPTRNHNVISFDSKFLKINNGYCDQTLYGTYNMNEVKEKYYIHSYAVTDWHANSLDIFTAADISQITYQLLLKSDYYIEDLNFDCNIPIQITGVDSSIVTNTYGFKIKNANNHMGRQKLYTYHIMLPTFNNLQLIRSLVLTTLITTFISLFFVNLYYWIRKRIGKIYNNNKLNFRQWRITLRILNRIRIFLFVLFICLSAILSILVLFDYPILVNEHKILKIGIIIIISSVTIIFGTVLHIAIAINTEKYKIKYKKFKNWIITHGNKKTIFALCIILFSYLAYIIWNQLKPLTAEDYYNEATKYKTMNNCEKSPKEVLNLYIKAASLGSMNAQYDLGCFYLNGGITPIDYEKSHEYFLKAAEQGHTESQYIVAMHYYYGKGTKINVNEAFRWWEKAAEQGHAESQYEAGICLMHDELGYTDYKKAFYYLLKAAHQNIPKAQCLVVQCYLNGWGVEQNKKEGVEWLRIAAKNKEENALKYLEELKEEGELEDLEQNNTNQISL